MTPESVAVVLADKDTGKAYYRPLTHNGKPT